MERRHDLTPDEAGPGPQFREEPPRDGNQHKRWLIAVLAVVALFVALLALRNYSSDPPADTPPGNEATTQTRHSLETLTTHAALKDVQVIKPQRRDMVYAVTLPANIAPLAQATIYAKVAGYIESIRHDKGDWVKKGELLAVIDDPELKAQYQKAVSEYAIKRLTYERLFNVWKGDPDVVAKQDVDVAEAASEGARGSMEQLKAMLQYVDIRAPFGGVITARFVDVGALVQAATASATAATPLFTLMDIDTVRVYVNVPQVDVPMIKEGTPVRLTVKELPGMTYAAAVTRSTVALDANTRTMLVESDMANPGHLLHPGMFAYVTLSLVQHPDALTLPPQAVLREQGVTFVFTIEEGKANKRPIKTAIESKGWLEVSEGLTGQEDVVVLGKTRLTEGQPVSPSPYSLPAGTPAVQPR